MNTFPFRFYGSGCTDWYEGANVGHAFSVRFAEPPTEATAELVASEFERSLWRGSVELGGPWLWSGPCAHFYVGERWSEGSAHVDRIAEVLRRLHATVPIVDVVYAGARAGGDAWSAWSLEQGAPSAGPEVPGFTWVGMHARTVDAALPPASTWAVFESARAAHRATIDDRAFDAKLAAQSADGSRLVELREGYLEPDLRALVPGLALAMPARARYGARWLLGEGDHPVRPRAGGPIIAVVVRHVRVGTPAVDAMYADLAWVDSTGARRQPSWERAVERSVAVLDTHPSLPALLARVDGVLFEVDLETGGARELYRDACDDAAYLGSSDALAVTHAGKAGVVRRVEGGWTLVAQRPDPNKYVAASLGPDGFVTWSLAKGLTLYRLVGTKLEKIASTALGVSFAFERDQELYCRRGARLFHWAGAADAWRAAGDKAREPRESASAKPKAGPRAAAPAFILVDALPDVPWAKVAWATERLGGDGHSVVSSRGDVAASHGTEASRFHYDRLAYRAVDGEVRDLSSLVAPFLDGVIEEIHFDRDDHLVLRSGGRLLRVVPEPFDCEVVADFNVLGARPSTLCDQELLVAGWTDTVAFLRRGEGTFATSTTLSLKGTHRPIFVDGANEIALVAARAGGAHLLQRTRDKLKKLAKHPGKVTRCLRVGQRVFVADGDQSVYEVVGLLGDRASH